MVPWNIKQYESNGHIIQKIKGEVAEWLKAHAWKACKRETVSRVRIPLSPPFIIHIQLKRVLR